MKKDKRGPAMPLRDRLLYGVMRPARPEAALFPLLQALAAAMLTEPAMPGTGGSNRLRPGGYRSQRMGHRLLSQLDPHAMEAAKHNAAKRMHLYRHKGQV